MRDAVVREARVVVRRRVGDVVGERELLLLTLTMTNCARRSFTAHSRSHRSDQGRFHRGGLRNMADDLASTKVLSETKPLTDIVENLEDIDTSALWDAVRDGDQVVIDELLVGDEEHPPLGVPVDVKDAEGLTPLHLLTVEGHASCAQWLIDEVRAAVDVRDSPYEQTPLHHAAAKGKATCAALLLSATPIRWPATRRVDAPLHAVARSGFTDVAAVILAALRPEQIDLPGGARGETALHRAAFWGNHEVAELLLKAGADRRRRNDAGARPVELACEGGVRPSGHPRDAEADDAAGRRRVMMMR